MIWCSTLLYYIDVSLSSTNTPAYKVHQKFQFNFEISYSACRLFDLVQGLRRGQTLISSGQGHEASALRRDCYRPQGQITFPSGHLDLSKEPHANYVERLVKERPRICQTLKKNFRSKDCIIPTRVKTGLSGQQKFLRNRFDSNFFFFFFFFNARIPWRRKNYIHITAASDSMTKPVGWVFLAGGAPGASWAAVIADPWAPARSFLFWTTPRTVLTPTTCSHHRPVDVENHAVIDDSDTFSDSWVPNCGTSYNICCENLNLCKYKLVGIFEFLLFTIATFNQTN